MMAAGKEGSENLMELMVLLGGISEDDCNLLMEEYKTTDPLEVSDAVFDSIAASNFDSVSDLVWHIRQNPFGGGVNRREKHADDSWCSARSKSSNAINKHASSLPVTPHRRPSSGAGNFSVQAAIPFSGTKHPVSIVRTPKRFDAEVLRLYLSKYVQDNNMRSILYDVYEKRKPKQLILLRGASGAGKSTLALVLWSITDKGEICSTDHYFINRHGQYDFKREQLGEAHASCRMKCENGMQFGVSPIIIDNTNTRVDEMMLYVELAVEHNYDIQIVEPTTEWSRNAHLLAQKTVHGVTKRSIQDQLDRFENTSVKAMVDRVLKQHHHPTGPVRNLEWDVTGLDGGGDWVGATAALTTTSSTSKPVANNNFQPLVTPAIKPNLSTPKTPIPLLSFPAFQPRTATQASVNSQPSFDPVVSKSSACFPNVSTSKPAVTKPEISWTETPTNTVTSPKIMISDWVPDIKAGNGNGKSQRTIKSGKQNANATGAGHSTVAQTEFVDPVYMAFEKLCKLFPSVSEDEIERLFNLYEGDLDLCGSVLIDQGIELNDLGDLGENDPSVPSSIESPPPPPLSASDSPEENPSNVWEEPLPLAPVLHTVTENCRNTDEAYENKVDPIPHQNNFKDATASSSSSSGGDIAAMEDEMDYFDMILPTEFAKSLLTAFGHPDDESRVLSKDELTIKVSPDTAFELYKDLYLNMHRAETEGARAVSEETSTPTSASDDDEFTKIAISISQMELETSSGDPQLSSIIDIESKISLQTKESLKKYTAPNRTMAQNVNFCLLKQHYPHIDVAVIDEIYCQYQLDIRKTEAFLDEMYCQSLQSNVQPSISAGTNTPENGWHLKYNPKDVKLYSTEELKSITKIYEEMEREWMSEMDKIKDCHRKCKTLSNPQVKAFYVSEAKTLSDSMKKLSEELEYYKAITQNANHRNDQILDLHGLKLNGAMRVLKEFLQFKEEEFLSCGVPKMILLIITGQGKHSRNSVPVLQPAVNNFLAQKNYKYHSSKPGTYTVILTRGSVARKW